MDLAKFDGTPLDTAPRGLKLRLADVYRKPGQTAAEVLKEINALTDKDMADYRQWFADAGYPCTP